MAQSDNLAMSKKTPGGKVVTASISPAFAWSVSSEPEGDRGALSEIEDLIQRESDVARGELSPAHGDPQRALLERMARLFNYEVTHAPPVSNGERLIH